jgi:hypothetical protein
MLFDNTRQLGGCEVSKKIDPKDPATSTKTEADESRTPEDRTANRLASRKVSRLASRKVSRLASRKVSRTASRTTNRVR